jgi:Ca-activated chloride channel family protein
VQDFSESRDIYEGVFDVKAKGMTILNDAIVRAAEELEKRTEKRRAIIVLSDGADTQSGASADVALRRALDANAVIYTVDMTGLNGGRTREEMLNKGILEKFADRTGGRYISTPGGAALRDAFKNIVEELGRQYTLAYYPANAKKDGKWRAIEVRTKSAGLVVRSRKGYNAPKK